MAVYSVVFALVVLELFLQVLPQGEIKPALWPPVRQALLEPDPKLMPGVHGDSTFTGNSVGIREPELPELNDRDQVYKIVTVGGKVPGKPVKKIGIPRLVVHFIHRFNQSSAEERSPHSIHDDTGKPAIFLLCHEVG